MKALNTHLLQLAVSRLNPLAEKGKQRLFVGEIRSHAPMMLGDQIHAALLPSERLLRTRDIGSIAQQRGVRRQRGGQRMNQGEFMPGGGSKGKRNRHTLQVTQPMQAQSIKPLFFRGNPTQYAFPCTFVQRSARARWHSGIGKVSMMHSQEPATCSPNQTTTSSSSVNT